MVKCGAGFSVPPFVDACYNPRYVDSVWQAGRTNPNVSLSVTEITPDKVTIRSLQPPPSITTLDDVS